MWSVRSEGLERAWSPSWKRASTMGELLWWDGRPTGSFVLRRCMTNAVSYEVEPSRTSSPSMYGVYEIFCSCSGSGSHGFVLSLPYRMASCFFVHIRAVRHSLIARPSTSKAKEFANVRSTTTCTSKNYSLQRREYLSSQISRSRHPTASNRLSQLPNHRHPLQTLSNSPNA
jgi:hypothetical protein